MERVCSHCSEPYSTTATHSKYCGEPCSRRAFRQRHPDRVAVWERNKSLKKRGLDGIEHYERGETHSGDLSEAVAFLTEELVKARIRIQQLEEQLDR